MNKIWIGFGCVIFFISQIAFALPGTFGLSPDNNRTLLLSVFNDAKSTIEVNIYQFDNQEIADALTKKIKEGLTVRLLVEGQPLGKISPDGKKVLEQLRNAMQKAPNKQNRLFMMTDLDDKSIKRRYRYNHAKYVIADKKVVLISSENFTGHGHPEMGEIGNRGWEVVIESVSLARKLQDIFEFDIKKEYEDVVRIQNGPIPNTNHIEDFSPPSEKFYRPFKPIPIGEGNVRKVRVIDSPDSSRSLKSMIRTAKTSIEVEQMSFPPTWRDNNHEKQVSPMIIEIVKAAKRGVKVKVLVNDDRVFDPGSPEDEKKPNQLTADLFMEYARCYDLPISARVIDIEKTALSYIHNKGVIVDNELVLVSSINWTKNSVMNNREIAVLMESEDAAKYYKRAFDFDWFYSEKSAAKAARHLTGPCPPLPQ